MFALVAMILIPLNVIEADASHNIKPGAPTGLDATATGSSQVTLNWNSPISTTPTDSPIINYMIEYGPRSVSWDDDSIIRVETHGPVILTPVHTIPLEELYDFRVYAENILGYGPPSNKVTVDPR